MAHLLLKFSCADARREVHGYWQSSLIKNRIKRSTICLSSSEQRERKDSAVERAQLIRSFTGETYLLLEGLQFVHKVSLEKPMLQDINVSSQLLDFAGVR